jgi:hypothetical protein
VNLAWKLAALRQGLATPALLDSYEPERIAFARRLVATTDRAFTAVTGPGPLARFIRIRVMPRLFPLLARPAAFRRFMFRTISQTALHYRASALSEGRAGRVAGGDRLPWVPAGAASDASPAEGGGAADGPDDNFAPLASLDWQVHVYGAPSPRLAAVCAARGLALHVFPWLPAAQRAGLKQGAAYLVRPDGYVGLADPRADPPTLERYHDTRGIRPLPGPVASVAPAPALPFAACVTGASAGRRPGVILPDPRPLRPGSAEPFALGT